MKIAWIRFFGRAKMTFDVVVTIIRRYNSKWIYQTNCTASTYHTRVSYCTCDVLKIVAKYGSRNQFCNLQTTFFISAKTEITFRTINLSNWIQNSHNIKCEILCVCVCVLFCSCSLCSTNTPHHTPCRSHCALLFHVRISTALKCLNFFSFFNCIFAVILFCFVQFMLIYYCNGKWHASTDHTETMCLSFALIVGWLHVCVFYYLVDRRIHAHSHCNALISIVC